MNNKKLLTNLILVFIILLIMPKYAYSLGADKAHPWITKEAAQVWPCKDLIEKKDPQGKIIGYECFCHPDSPPQACTEFQEYLGTIDSSTDKVSGITWLGPLPVTHPTNILAGSVMEDFDPPGCSALRHSYSGWEQINYSMPPCPSGMSAKDYCKELFDMAVGCYNRTPDINKMDAVAVAQCHAGNKSIPYYLVGKCAHLVGDMATPSHVHGDIHSLGIEFPEIAHPNYSWADKDLFELFMDSQIDTKSPMLSTYTDIAKDEFPNLPLYTDPKNILESMANETKKYPSNDTFLVATEAASRLYPTDFGWKWKIKNVYDSLFVAMKGKVITSPSNSFAIVDFRANTSKFFVETTGDNNNIVEFTLGFNDEVYFTIEPYHAQFTLEITIDCPPLPYPLCPVPYPSSFTTSFFDITSPQGTREITVEDILQRDLLTLHLDTVKPDEEVYLKGRQKTTEVCEEIAQNLIPPAISRTASLYNLFWKTVDIPPVVEYVKVWHTKRLAKDELKYDTIWQETKDSEGNVIERTKQETTNIPIDATEIGQTGIFSFLFSQLNLSFEIGFNQIVEQIPLSVKMGPDLQTQKVITGNWKGQKLWKGNTSIPATDLDNFLGENTLIIKGAKGLTKREIDANPGSVAKLSQDEKEWQQYEAVYDTNILVCKN